MEQAEGNEALLVEAPGPSPASDRAGLEPAADAYIGRRIAENPTSLGAGEAAIDHDWLIGRARLAG